MMQAKCTMQLQKIHTKKSPLPSDILTLKTDGPLYN